MRAGALGAGPHVFDGASRGRQSLIDLHRGQNAPEMTRTFTAQELSNETGVSVERIRWLVDAGVIERREPEAFNPGDGFRAKMVNALLDSGISREQIEAAVQNGNLSLSHVDRYILIEPGQRSNRTFAELMAGAGPRGSLLPSIYQLLGIPQPDPGAHLPVAEEELLTEFLEAWQLAPDDEALTRAARMVADGTRQVAQGWPDLFDEQVARPTRERLLRGEIDRFPTEVSQDVARQFHLIPKLVAWLTNRYVEQGVVSGIVEHLEEYLATRGLAPTPVAGPPPAVAFVDLSGYTRLTEEHGDEMAARTSELLRDRAEAAAEAGGGRLVKLLGDGAMLWFRDPGKAATATEKLVRDLREAGLPAHAGIASGPVVQRDLDLFGRTVNMASRIAGQAGPGQVVVSAEVARVKAPDGFGFEPIAPATLKGFDQPVPLFRLKGV
jgi:adenylate cyclase